MPVSLLPQPADRRRRLRATACLLLAALPVLACGRSDEAPGAAVSIARALSGDTAGFARAETPREPEFPRDHGPHPRFRTEWWYFTGNLDGPEGERFGYQLTVFRNALAPPPDGAPESVGRASRWATRQAWLAHFALTDAAGQRFFADQRLARGGPVGLAGASAGDGGLRLWVDDWSLAPAGPDAAAGRPASGVRGAVGLLPMRLEASQADLADRADRADRANRVGAAIDLTLEPGKPVVLHGDRGLSIKGRDASTGAINASYYYSFTRLPTSGTVTLGDRTVPVSGCSWMDREWSTSALSEDQVGWDWFALQLDDGRDLMIYALRRTAEAGDTIDPASSGTLVAPDGTARHLLREDLSIEVLGHWKSPDTGATYPSGWRLLVPSAALDVEVRPVLEDQELDIGFRYWEGAVDVHGTANGAPVGGRGYVELTGYGPDAAGTGGA